MSTGPKRARARVTGPQQPPTAPAGPDPRRDPSWRRRNTATEQSDAGPGLELRLPGNSAHSSGEADVAPLPSWRPAAGAGAAVRGGGVRLRVQVQDRLISIHSGDCFLLVKKTNEDWWQVRRDDGSKAFYVPAQYVREVRKALMPPGHAHGTAHAPGTRPHSAWTRHTALDTPLLLQDKLCARICLLWPHLRSHVWAHGRASVRAVGPRARRPRTRRPRASGLTHTGSSSSSTLPRSRGRSPELQRQPLDVDSQTAESGDEPKSHESESDLSSSSTEQLQWTRPENGGKTLYRAADSSRSEWELPKLNQSPPHVTSDVKTRSLDRRSQGQNIQKNWRHSSILMETNEKPSEKCGLLNMTKITENGKKVRKNWTSLWSVLNGSTLQFTKSQTGGSSWFGGQSKPELTVDLRGASVDWAPKDRSSKKHVLELKMRHGTELLIQSDNESLVQEWLRALQDAISAHAWESDENMDEDMPESPGPDDKNHKEKDKERESKKEKGMKNSNSVEVSEHKARHKLKKFLTRRPTLQAVRDKGYIKDQVFGCSLSSLCQRENSTCRIRQNVHRPRGDKRPQCGRAVQSEREPGRHPETALRREPR
ncbi:hypothetical protein WMY93_000290 [Mugilogobius chulae]|uniref:Uncharacterized protein n=1 Tax=Mugilogobius chulae TaxID=88201 RepID=A0AAW0Q9K5_9GOBI